MRRLTLLACSSLLFAAAAVSLFAQQGAQQGGYTTPGPAQQQIGKVRAIDPSKADFNVQKLGDSLYLLQPTPNEGAAGNFGGNVSAFVGDDGIVLIDPGFYNMATKLKAALKTISDKPVKYVLNTHWHGDHSEADSVFKKEGAIVIGQDNILARMKRGSPQFIPEAVDSFPVITFDHEITLHPTSSGEIHGIHVQPGHTSGDTIYIFPQAKVAQLGDDFTNGFGPGGYPAWDMDRDNTGGPAGPISAYEYVLDHLGEDAKVIPGHGNLATAVMLVKPLAFLKAAVAAVQADIDAGKSLDQIKQENLLAKLDYLQQARDKQDAYVERLYIALTTKNATPQPYHGN
jgi:glyoxylase-like metal-dependent hydrolase (beta-lactamase superfamily II)